MRYMIDEINQIHCPGRCNRNLHSFNQVKAFDQYFKIAFEMLNIVSRTLSSFTGKELQMLLWMGHKLNWSFDSRITQLMTLPLHCSQRPFSWPDNAVLCSWNHLRFVVIACRLRDWSLRTGPLHALYNPLSNFLQCPYTNHHCVQ